MTGFTGEEPFFSIITVCLNNLEGLMRTHASLRIQSCKNYEWIVVDGGSSDGTDDFLRALTEGSCRWISEPDKGLYDAMNKGIDMATGRWLLFLNSGDELASGHVLEKVVKSSRDSPDIIFGDAYVRTMDDVLVYKKARSPKSIWYGMFTHHQAIFYRRESVGAVRYDTSYTIGADMVFTIELIRQENTTRKVGFPVCVFEEGGKSFSETRQAEKEIWRIRREVLQMGLISSVTLQCLQKSISILRRKFPLLYRVFRYRGSSNG